MKLDLLCELELLSEKIESAALSPMGMFRDNHSEEEFEGVIDSTISVLDDGIDTLRAFVEGTFITRFYYEMQANVLESMNPTKIIEFYEERIKYIMGRIEDDPENWQQTEFINNSLRHPFNKGFISRHAKEHIERKRLMLTGVWIELFDWILGDLESIKSGISRPKKEKEIPKECPTNLAQIFNKAVGEGLMAKHGEQWKWIENHSLYGYFISVVTRECDMRDKSDRIRWKVFEPYIINHSKCLSTARQELNKYQNTTSVPPTGSKQVDRLFE